MACILALDWVVIVEVRKLMVVGKIPTMKRIIMDMIWFCCNACENNGYLWVVLLDVQFRFELVMHSNVMVMLVGLNFKHRVAKYYCGYNL